MILCNQAALENIILLRNAGPTEQKNEIQVCKIEVKCTATFLAHCLFPSF